MKRLKVVNEKLAAEWALVFEPHAVTLHVDLAKVDPLIRFQIRDLLTRGLSREMIPGVSATVHPERIQEWTQTRPNSIVIVDDPEAA